jgi:hypothetical protein
MKTSKYLILTVFFLLSAMVFAQKKQMITETVHVSGNCNMCKKTIEKVGFEKKVSEVNWNKDTKEATLTYNPKKTNKEQVLKKIALAGYDNEAFLAPNDAYASLMDCCQYDREMSGKTVIDHETQADHKTETIEPKAASKMTGMKHHAEMDMGKKTEAKTQEKDASKSQLKGVFDAYFDLKNALVRTDSKSASAEANKLLIALNAVKMNALAMEEHMVWMKVMADLKTETASIENSKDIAKQRKNFISLSEKMHDLAKVIVVDAPMYYQFCPMANNGKGANWLSKEKEVKNPYYGSMMLTCGSTVETIK